jgi:hypothetical protein
MDKIQLIDKVTNMATLDRDKILGWVKALPSSGLKVKPTHYTVGDVLLHPIFQHPYVLLQKKKDMWICAMLTSEANCAEILEATQSRFFDNNFFTKIIFTIKEPDGSMMGVYENKKHLRKIHADLKNIFK